MWGLIEHGEFWCKKAVSPILEYFYLETAIYSSVGRNWKFLKDATGINFTNFYCFGMDQTKSMGYRQES